MEFHNNLQEFINWLTQAEQGLTMASPASLILETIMFQIDEHKVGQGIGDMCMVLLWSVFSMRSMCWRWISVVCSVSRNS